MRHAMKRASIVACVIFVAAQGFAAAPQVQWLDATGTEIAPIEGLKRPIRFAVLAEGFAASDYSQKIANDKFRQSLKGLFDAFIQSTGNTVWLLGVHQSEFAFCTVKLISSTSGVPEVSGTTKLPDTPLHTVMNPLDRDNCWLQ